jgi:hypothetical protein
VSRLDIVGRFILYLLLDDLMLLPMHMCSILPCVLVMLLCLHVDVTSCRWLDVGNGNMALCFELPC